MRRWSVGLAAVIIACILVLELLGAEPDAYRTRRAEALVQECPEVCELSGRITEAVFAGEEKCRVTLDCGKMGKVLVTVRGEGCPYYDLPGRTARVRTALSLPKAASNPGTFDYRDHLRSEGIYLLGRCSGSLLPGPLSGVPAQPGVPVPVSFIHPAERPGDGGGRGDRRRPGRDAVRQ